MSEVRKPVKTAVIELLNRQFERDAIRQYLMQQQYTEMEIDQAFTALDTAESRNLEKTITPVNGFRGLYILIGSIALIFYELVYARDANNPMGEFARLLLGLIGVVYAISLLRRKLK